MSLLEPDIESRSINEMIDVFISIQYQYVLLTLALSFLSVVFDVKFFKHLAIDWESSGFDFPISIIISLVLYEICLIVNLFCLHKHRISNNGVWLLIACIFGLKSFIFATVGYLDLLVILDSQFNHIICFLGLFIYFLPFTIAHFRNHHNQLSIFILNFLLGWTIICWIIGLVMSLTKVSKK